MPTAKKATIFPAKKSAEAYGYLDPDPQKNVEKNLERLGGDINNVSPKTTAVGLFYVPGGEVANTSLEIKSWLGKFTYRLPARQSLKFGIRRTDTRFGEVMPSRILSGSGFQGDNYAIMRKIAEWPQAWVKQHAYNINYTWKPQNSPWLDLQASLWATRTKSKTNSAGGVPGDVPGLTTTGTATTSAGCMAAQEHAPARKTACPIPTAASIPAKAKPCMPPTTATVLPFPIK